jgi:eukaryotic-like serine/threonine-protein kinase
VAGHRDAPTIGSRVGRRYTLDAVLGSGAMGSVYRAHDAAGSCFAVKILRAGPKGNPGDAAERRARFLREAALCAALHHPNVVPVLDHGIDAARELPYLVMPLLEGEDLAAVLHRVRWLDPPAAVALVVQACAGLSAVHAHGIVHRDVKPSNLFLQSQGTEVLVKVTDFGLAKAFDASADRGALTATGRFMGTPQYVSPEQAVSAKHVDVRSDVFSLAMSLYHALSGAPAFSYVRSFMALVLELTSREAPPLQDAAPWVPAPVARIVHAALLREPAARCPSVAELALALDMAVGIDASRRGVSRETLGPPPEATRARVATRAARVSSWDDILRA